MAKPVDINALMLEQMKRSGKTQEQILDAMTAQTQAIEGFASALNGNASGGGSLAGEAPRLDANGGAPPGPPKLDTGGVAPDSPPRLDANGGSAPPAPAASGGALVAEGLAQLGAAMGEAAGDVLRFAAGFDPEVLEGLSRAAGDMKDALGAALAPALEAAATAAQAFDVALAVLGEAASTAGGVVRSFASAVAASPVGQAVGGAAKVVGGVAHVAGDAASAVGTAGAAVGGAVMGGLEGVANVAGAVTGAFTGVVDVATKFVGALNPDLLLPLTQAFNDLSATIGVALTPVISGATEILRSLGSVLLPVMESLTPVVAALTQVFVDLMPSLSEALGKAYEAMMPLYEVVVEVVQALAPFVEVVISLVSTFVALLRPALTVFVGLIQVLLIPIKMLSDLLLALTPLFEVLAGVASGVASALKAVMDGWLGGMGGLKDTFSGVQDSVRAFAKELILGTAALAKLAGWNDFLHGFVASFNKTKREDNSGIAAMSSTKTSDFSAFAKEVALASAKAGVGGTEVQSKRAEDWLEEIKNKLVDIEEADEDNAEELATRIIAGVEAALRKQFPTAAAFTEGTANFVKFIGGAVRGAAGVPGL